MNRVKIVIIFYVSDQTDESKAASFLLQKSIIRARLKVNTHMIQRRQILYKKYIERGDIAKPIRPPIPKPRQNIHNVISNRDKLASPAARVEAADVVGIANESSTPSLIASRDYIENVYTDDPYFHAFARATRSIFTADPLNAAISLSLARADGCAHPPCQLVLTPNNFHSPKNEEEHLI